MHHICSVFQADDEGLANCSGHRYVFIHLSACIGSKVLRAHLRLSCLHSLRFVHILESNNFYMLWHLGIWRISRIKEKKVRHKWAYLVMKELVQCASLYKYDDNGQNPENSRLDNKHGEPFLVPGDRPVPENTETSQKNIVLSTPAKKNTQQSRRKETPLLIATKTGVLEIVEKILDAFPVAIQDEDANGKNVVLLAVEHRQTHIYELLLKKKMIMENAFRKLDNQGNSALHYAAKFENHRPSSLIPGAALQMQWEIKWYKVRSI